MSLSIQQTNNKPIFYIEMPNDLKPHEGAYRYANKHVAFSRAVKIMENYSVDRSDEIKLYLGSVSDERSYLGNVYWQEGNVVWNDKTKRQRLIW